MIDTHRREWWEMKTTEHPLARWRQELGGRKEEERSSRGICLPNGREAWCFRHILWFHSPFFIPIFYPVLRPLHFQGYHSSYTATWGLINSERCCDWKYGPWSWGNNLVFGPTNEYLLELKWVLYPHWVLVSSCVKCGSWKNPTL